VRLLLLAALFLLTAAPAAEAAKKYRVSHFSLHRVFPSTTWTWGSYPGNREDVRNLRGRVEMQVMAVGPPGGQRVRRVQVRITGLSCPSKCRDRSWSLKLPAGITPSGRAARNFWVPPWGCGKPVARARLQFKDGSYSRWHRWKPDTACD
jgi:hypothetical protein